jgi:hypothetical protein
LAEVVQYKTGQHDEIPGSGDGFAPEVAHVGVECFGSRYRKHDTAEHRRGLGGMLDEQA